MAAVAHDFISYAQTAAAAFNEAAEAFATKGMSEAERKDAAAYSAEFVATGADRLLALARKYLVSAEFRAWSGGDQAPPRPIIRDRAFCECLVALVRALNACGAHAGTGARRLAATLANWVDSGAPSCAATIAVQAETLARLSKRRGGRAAL